MQKRMHADNHGILFDFLYDTEFRWDPHIPRDSDRASDGRFLRVRFAEECGMELPPGYEDHPCSFLEFAIALAYSIDDEIMYDPDNPEQVATWFWLIFGNLGLDAFTDAKMVIDGMYAYDSVTEIVDRAMDRTYEYNGYLGMFPLRKPRMDQRHVEIWYQANAYFIENFFEREELSWGEDMSAVGM